MAWDGLIGEVSNFLGLDAILDPGADDRRAAASAQERATQLWLREMSGLPGADAYHFNEDAINSGPSSLSNSSLAGNGEYQQGRQAQMQALQQMQGIANAGGYTALERDQIAQAQRQAAGYEKSQRDAQIQQMQMRGMAGGGGEMAARMAAQQGGANRAAGDATNIATQAQMRALQAMQAGGQIGQQAQTQATNRASALDAFNQANVNRQQGVAQRNSASQTAAQQQATQDRMSVLAGATNQFNGNSAAATAEANRQAAQNAGLIQSFIS
jgi:hypothetical protein